MVGHCGWDLQDYTGPAGKWRISSPRALGGGGAAHPCFANCGLQLPVLALLARVGGSVGGVKFWTISLRRSRRDSPTRSDTCVHASRSFSSGVAAIREIISRDR